MKWIKKHIQWLIILLFFITLMITVQVLQTRQALATTTTNSPTTNSGTAWTNPTNAYADGTNYANKSSSTAGNNTWGTYGFSLAGGDTVTSVRVRYDAWSAGNTTANQSRVPTGDNATIDGTWAVNPTSPTTRWDKIDDAVGTHDAGLTFIVGLTGGNCSFTYPVFTVPTGSTIASVVVYFNVADNSSGNNNIGPSLVVGDKSYGGTLINPGTVPPTWVMNSNTWTLNPATGSAWTVDEVNGVGLNGLRGFGLWSDDLGPDVDCTQLYIAVNYTEYDDQIAVQVSWDGGVSWSISNVTTLTNAETTYWADVTGATAWTPTKLNDANFQVRVGTKTSNAAEAIYLDWLPVEVIYTPAAAGALPEYVQDETWW